jgi:hypothetical protein
VNQNKIFGFLLVGFIVFLFFSAWVCAQTPVAAQDPGEGYRSIQPTATTADFNVEGYEATPLPTPVPQHLKLAIPKRHHLTPTVTIGPTQTMTPTPKPK